MPGFQVLGLNCGLDQWKSRDVCLVAIAKCLMYRRQTLLHCWARNIASAPCPYEQGSISEVYPSYGAGKSQIPPAMLGFHMVTPTE